MLNDGRVRVMCLCGWRSYRKKHNNNNSWSCPRCQRYTVRQTTHAEKIEVYVPPCGHCKFFERNKGFPNRLGKCLKVFPNMSQLKDVWDRFGCLYWEALDETIE